MAENQENQKTEQTDIIPVDTPDSEITSIISDEEPEIVVARLEKMAELAPRRKQAMQTILMTFTFPQDWETFGTGDKAKVCLSSAGAMRVACQFPIQFFEVTSKKETWTDSIGSAYRYIFEGKARLGDKVVFAQGNYSTRDNFLGKASGEYKDPLEINEGHIRNAAYHIFEGNAAKALLGLRAMPKAEYEKLMGQTKQDAKKTTAHTYGKGTKGGTKQDDSKKQKELAELCIAIVQIGYTVELRNNEVVLTQMSDADSQKDEIEVAKAVCIEMSSFEGDKGIVTGKPASQLKGAWLDKTLEKAQTLFEKAKQ